MLSRLHRGDSLPVETMVWRLAGLEPVTGEPDLNPPHGKTGSGKTGNGKSNDALSQQLAAEIEQGRRQAHAQGRQEGEAAATAQAQARVEGLAGRLAHSIEEITGLRQRLRHESEQDIVALALAIARRVLHRELTVEPEAVVGLLKAALERMDLRELHRIRVHPETAAILEKHLERIGIPQRVELIADPALERGALVLEGSSGSLDASVETQLAEIERGFADLVRRNA